MSAVHDYGGMPNFWPTPGLWGFDFSGSMGAASAIDAAGEEYHVSGVLFIDGRPTSAKTLSSAGGEIRFLAGARVFANAGTTIRIGIQDVAGTGTPARGDGTFDVYRDHVGGTHTIVDNGDNTMLMTTGSKSLSHGDLISIVFSMTSRGGADSLSFRGLNSGDMARHWPQVVANAPAGTYTKANRFPTVMLKFDDGTYGWLVGTVPVNASYVSLAYDLNTTPDEYGNAMTFTRPVLCEGLWAYCYPLLSGPTEALLYSTPTGTPAVLKTLNIDHDHRTEAGLGIWQGLFAEPQLLMPNVEYGVCFRPTTTDDFQLPYGEVADANYWKSQQGGTQCCALSRTNNSGAFTKTTTRRFTCGILLAGGDDGRAPRLGFQLGI